MSIIILIIFVVVLLLGGGLLLFISTRGHGRSSLNVERYRSEWLAIEQSVEKGNQSSYQLAILNADKLLDKALRERGFRGETMGERMKSAGNSWKNANHIWTAHKLRNRIAHETSVDVSHELALRALVAFKQALKDMGAI